MKLTRDRAMLAWVHCVLRAAALMLALVVLSSEVISAQVHVRGYYRRDGTYVRPHVRTLPDGNPYNNYSFPGNYNPNTGRITPGNPQSYLRRYYGGNIGPLVTRLGQDYSVDDLQYSLHLLGHDPGPIDGVYGPSTALAIRAFQRRINLPVTGVVSPDLIDQVVASLEKQLEEEVQPSTVVDLPSNAHLNYLGNGWECDSGYRRAGGGCERVRLPSNAHLNYLGNGWECDSGYRRASGGCERVRLPPNAHLNYLGNGWECDNGYRRAGGGCERVHLPPNAHLNYLGNGWECDSGYRRAGNSCVKAASRGPLDLP